MSSETFSWRQEINVTFMNKTLTKGIRTSAIIFAIAICTIQHETVWPQVQNAFCQCCELARERISQPVFHLCGKINKYI